MASGADQRTELRAKCQNLRPLWTNPIDLDVYLVALVPSQGVGEEKSETETPVLLSLARGGGKDPTEVRGFRD